MNDVNTFIEAWADAERDGDAVTTDRLLTDDFVGIGPLGFELAKSAWLQRQTIGGLHYDRLSLDEISTRAHGDCAITTVRWNAQGNAACFAPSRKRPRATLVTVKDHNDWLTREHPLQLHRRNRRRPRESRVVMTAIPPGERITGDAP